MSKSGNRKSRSNEGFILYQNNVGKTVQTSWRPQLPLPKEVVPPTTSAEPSTRSSEMNRHSNAANHSSNSNKKDTYQSAPQITAGGNKKWSFGRLFRKKKEVETESSSEEDRKAGFVVSPKYRKKDKKKRGSKLIGGGFDHIVVSPTRDNEFFLPFEPVPAAETHPATHLSPPVDAHSRSTNSLDRRSKRDRKKSGVKDAQQRHSSSEEEMISLNSSTTFTRYRSDESLGSGGNGNGGQSRRSRAARNERYYKRLSRDGEVSNGQVPVTYAPQPAQRWKTQPVPLSIYNGQISQIAPPAGQKARPQYPPPSTQDQKIRNSTSLSHVAPYVPATYGMHQPPKNLQNTVNDAKRSISYDSHIHLQNIKKPLPPPPPPRDPLRRVNVAGHNDTRPISYAFDQSSSHAPTYTGMSGRCVSDDRIWSGNAPLYQSASSINNPPQSAASSQLNRRFITRAERDAHPTKKSLPSGLDFRYVAEATPRSRKPIHLFNQEEDKPVKPPSPVIIRTTKSGLPGPAPAPVSNQSNPQLSSEFWRRGRDHHPRPETIFNKPRSVSSSRVRELRSYDIPMYSEVSKPKSKPPPADEVDHVVSGSLLIKPSKDNHSNYVEIRNNANKSNSMPNHYQRRDLGAPRPPKADSPTPNKYDEYVAERRVRNILDQPLKMAPDPPQRKVVTKPLTLPPEPDVIMRKKPTNLEDAINELEAIYKSLKLGDESLLDRAERRDIPTPTNFEKYAELHTGEFLDDDDDEPAGEPDLVRDDFAYRNINHANLAIKASEKQPPFGIPIGPIAPSPRTDYLHVTPEKDSQKVRTAPFKYPDIVCDDLAVRTLRKDPPGQVKQQFAYPPGSMKKKRATRTQSANIYTLIQRNAAKPSGGDLHDYLELAKTLERAGSLSDIHKETDDIPSTLQLLRNLREQEQGSPKVLPFRHPSQGGAICSLPAVLIKDEEKQVAKPPIPLPRKSLSPDPEKTKMEDALNKIAKEAKESSEKLTRELMELRKEALITSSRPKVNKPSIERDLEQIEAVSEAAKRCRHILMDTIPPEPEEEQQSKQTPPRRLVTEDKLIKAIDQVSDAANKVCEKILNEIVTVEPPVIVQNAIEVKNRPKQELVTPSLIQKLDPSSARIGEIAERCMRQISELNDLPDYDNLHQQIQVTACNTTKTDTDREKRSDADLLIVPGSANVAANEENEEEIDKIMKECEEQARSEASKPSAKVEDPPSHSDDATDVFVSVGDKTTTTTSASSSSDCLKSSSPSAGPHLSSSITSFNPYSSSDYIKSPSSEFHAPSTDPIKTFSTTSYDVQSSSVTPNITNSPFSSTPSPPLNLTYVCSSGGEKGERSDSASQYNSSEELAMIFGIEKSSPATTTTGKEEEEDEEVVVDCPVPSPVGVLRCSEPNKPDVLPIATTTTATNPEFCESVIVCKLDTIDEDREDPSPSQISRLYLPSYASNISIVVTNVMGNDGGDEESPHIDPQDSSSRQLDSISSIDESSNPDSGNVSLSDFPVQSPINASLEVELPHNSRFEIAKRFVNEVTIDGEPSEVDYLRSLFAQDEMSTSFSTEETLAEILSDHDEDHQVQSTKDQHSPGQLLNEVLSQVSRINAGTHRRQLISQLENISECTKIVEGLSDRLSHQGSRLRNRDEMSVGKSRGMFRVRFSDDFDSDHEEEDRSDCLKSLELLGHHLSSSEESIPPLGEIFNVPLTDSENEECDRSPSIRTEPLSNPSFNFERMQKSFEEECNTLKEALHRVVKSGIFTLEREDHDLIEDDLEIESPGEDQGDSVGFTPQVVSVIEVVDAGLKNYLDDPQLKTLLSEVTEDESLTLSSEVVSIIEVVDPDAKGRSNDLQIEALISEPLRSTSEVVSIIEIVDSKIEDGYRLKALHSESSDDTSDLKDEFKYKALNSESSEDAADLKDEFNASDLEDESRLKTYCFESLEDASNVTDDFRFNIFDVKDKSSFKAHEDVSDRKDESSCKALLSEPLEDVFELRDDFKTSDLKDESGIGAYCLESLEYVSDLEDESRFKGLHSESLEAASEIKGESGYKAHECDLSKAVCDSSELELVQELNVADLSEIDSPVYNPIQVSKVVFVESDDEPFSHDPKPRPFTGKAYLSPVNISLKIVNQVSKVSFVDCTDDEAFGFLSQLPDMEDEICRASKIIEVDSGLLENTGIPNQSPKMPSTDSESELSESCFVTSGAYLKPLSGVSVSQFDGDEFLMHGRVNPVNSSALEEVPEASASNIIEVVDTEDFGSQESLEIVYDGPEENLTGSQINEPSSSNCPQRHHPSSSEGSIQLSHRDCDQSREPSQEKQNKLALLKYRPSSSPADISPSQVPSTPTTPKSLTLLAQPRYDDRLTTLEHILLACTLGVVTGNDFITMLAIIIGVLTLIAIVLL